MTRSLSVHTFCRLWRHSGKRSQIYISWIRLPIPNTVHLIIDPFSANAHIMKANTIQTLTIRQIIIVLIFGLVNLALLVSSDPVNLSLPGQPRLDPGGKDIAVNINGKIFTVSIPDTFFNSLSLASDENDSIDVKYASIVSGSTYDGCFFRSASPTFDNYVSQTFYSPANPFVGGETIGPFLAATHLVCFAVPDINPTRAIYPRNRAYDLTAIWLEVLIYPPTATSSPSKRLSLSSLSRFFSTSLPPFSSISNVEPQRHSFLQYIWLKTSPEIKDAYNSDKGGYWPIEAMLPGVEGEFLVERAALVHDGALGGRQSVQAYPKTQLDSDVTCVILAQTKERVNNAFDYGRPFVGFFGNPKGVLCLAEEVPIDQKS